VNFRSTSEIVEASSRVIRGNRNRISKHLRSAAGPGREVRVLECEDLRLEYQQLVFDIYDRVREGYRMQDIAILYRTNYQRRPLEQFFRDCGLDLGKFSAMTYHASKGLEFPVVYLPDLNDGVVPSRVHGQPCDLEEERRAFYVAMTRAEKELILLYCRKRRERTASVSPFLVELIGWQHFR